jgi:predicted SAM-dependent methyltransferase
MKKINVGCGWGCKEGWLNVDNTQKPQRENYPITFMDATQTWPYEDNTFDYILSEHMIEHIEDSKGLFAMKEAYRTMKEGGVVRISCPDRDFYENLPGKDDLEYVQNYTRMAFKRDSRVGDAAKIAKRGLTEQGHVWVPTAEQLINKLKDAGFKDVKLVKFGESEHAELQNIDMDDGIRCWESLYVEGTK